MKSGCSNNPEALLQGLNPQQSSGVWVTNYTLIDFLHHHWANYPQRPLFANSGSAIDLTRIWKVQKQESGHTVSRPAILLMRIIINMISNYAKFPVKDMVFVSL
ncbi:hypothetical protein H6G97_31230 [Nostoc flagelliforme FACHB-838]|uniref:Transposase n=1 Tax=Nostoc flagelliforme FACHB-838 TaxID=2692904 RepID=A0ABR8DZI8_9NOSO|nr:hypothetical protein [Nostoc flagelliforme]MBD2533788.1 hypothetical protein [Nostoc flagelliforme FACHB-838]